LLLPIIILSILNGLMLGLIYGLMSIGITFIYGTMKAPNFAHGEFYMAGAYASYFAVTILNIPTFLTIPVSLLAGFALGYVVEQFLISDTYKKKIERPGEYAMLTTLGLSILLQNMIKEFYSPFMKSTPPILPGTVPFYLVSINLDRIIVSIISVVTLALLFLFIGKTKEGRSWRAAAQNKIGALVAGVNIERACRLSYGVGGALAALAGCLLAPLYGLYPNMGYWPLTISFVAMTLGGLGSLKGSLIGGMIIGLAHTFTASFIGSSYADVGMYAILIIVILVKPTGLFGRRD
jgi:branched-chain amino acid transport system permease protein